MRRDPFLKSSTTEDASVRSLIRTLNLHLYPPWSKLHRPGEEDKNNNKEKRYATS